MNTKDIEYFKAKLTAEKEELEGELAGIGRKNPQQPGGWEATANGMEVDSADENEVADKLEELEDNAAIMTQLENQLNEVKAALDRIEKGTYGLDEETKEPIDKKRLEANPAARTAIKPSK